VHIVSVRADLISWSGLMPLH